MAKIKTVMAPCPICKKTVFIKLSSDLVLNRKYYPFEHLYIHGKPKHALLLFLDANLAVRDKIPYNDITLAEKEKVEYADLLRKSKFESLASINSNITSSKILTLLREGPKTEEILLNHLKQEENFREKDFNKTIFPLIKTGLVKTSWVEDTYQAAYFLVKDFIAFRIPSTKTIDQFLLEQRYKAHKDSYQRAVRGIFKGYIETYLNDPVERIKEIKYCIELSNNNIYRKINTILQDGPNILQNFSDVNEMMMIKRLVEENMIFEFKIKNQKHYALISDVKLEVFTPKHILEKIFNLVKFETISKEMANSQLELLYEGKD